MSSKTSIEDKHLIGTQNNILIRFLKLLSISLQFALLLLLTSDKLTSDK